MKILGIDPGLRKTGWGIVRFNRNNIIYVGDGYLLQNDNISLGEKLLKIFNDIIKIIDDFKPDLVGIEQTFVGSGNVSSLKLGMARGVSILAATKKMNVQIIGAATETCKKKNITGSGIASKDQVKEMVKKLLNVNPKNEDSSDALAVAISSQAYSPNMKNQSIDSTNNLNKAIKKALMKENLQNNNDSNFKWNIKIKKNNNIIIEVNGVGYELLVSKKQLIV